MTTVALAVLVHNRPAELNDALDSAGGFDEVIVLDNASDPPAPRRDGATWIRSEVNLGVSAGRNKLAQETAHDVIFFLDDDAVIRTPDVAAELRRRFDEDDRLAAIAFKIVRHDGHMERSEFPFRGTVRHADRGRPCSYFLGGAVAVRRSAFLVAHGFDESFLYSTEEIDLALKWLRDGWRLRYEPSLVIEHRPSPRGRTLAPRVPAMYLQNRIVYARRHLPAALAAVHVAIWSARTFIQAARARSTAPWRAALRRGLQVPVERRPVAWRRLLAAHRWGGRIVW